MIISIYAGFPFCPNAIFPTTNKVFPSSLQVISVLAFIGFAARFIHLSVREVPEVEPVPDELKRLLADVGHPRITADDAK